MLTLFEEFLSLSIHETKGTYIRSSIDRLKPGLVGAIFAELALMGKIQASNNHRLQLADDSQTTDDILNEALSSLKESDKDRKFEYWINTFGQRVEKLRKQMVKNLVQKGVVTQDDDRVFWVIPSPLQPEAKVSTKYLLILRLRGIVLAQENTQPRDIALLSLVRACGLLDLLFLRDELKLADRQINELVFKQALNNPVIQTIQEIECAIADVVEED
jgi:Golgi phosphoprotein 3